jgi:ABC-2 type transport system ATP-binding protein
LRRAIGALVPEHTVLLTTHDMNEADQLCREIAIIDRGLIVAQGTPDQLKARVGGARRIVVTTHQPLNGRVRELETELRRLPTVRNFSSEVTETGGSEVTVLCNDTAQTLDETLALLRQTDASIDSVRVIEPTLEDAFLAVTGRSFE